MQPCLQVLSKDHDHPYPPNTCTMMDPRGTTKALPVTIYLEDGDLKVDRATTYTPLIDLSFFIKIIALDFDDVFMLHFFHAHTAKMDTMHCCQLYDEYFNMRT